MRPAPRWCTATRSREPASPPGRNVVAELHGEWATSPPALPPRTAPRAAWRTSASSTRPWRPTPPRVAGTRTAASGRTNSQVPYLVRRPAGSSACPRPGPRPHRPGRRRLRRQAGAAHRRPRHARRAATAAPGAVRVHAHRRVHYPHPAPVPRRPGAAADSTACSLRCARRADEHRRLREPRPGVMFHGCASRGRLPLREQAGGRAGGLHEQPAVRVRSAATGSAR